VPNSGAFRLPRASAVAGEPRRRVVRERPHKELTVEMKNQKWVRFEGDRFRFPGGGTMFPRGASAYIDDIGKLINLKDGSIRTAIDTGCGVRAFLNRFGFRSFILSDNLFSCLILHKNVFSDLIFD